MSEQLTLLPPSIDQRFWRFHRNNPSVYRELVRYTGQAADRGARRVSMKLLIEQIRASDIGPYVRIDNSFTSRYVRLLVEEHPQFAPLFEMRKLASA